VNRPITVLLVSPDTDVARLVTVDQELEAFQELVGGDIEGLTLGEVSAYLNTNGKALGLPLNAYADALIRDLLADTGHRLLPGDAIVGPVAFMGPPDRAGYDTSIPAETIARAERLGLTIEKGASDG